MSNPFKMFNRVALGLLFMAALTPCLCCSDVPTQEKSVHAKVDADCCHSEKHEDADHHDQGACFHPMNKQAEGATFSSDLKPASSVALAAGEGLRNFSTKQVDVVFVSVVPAASPPSRSSVLRI